AEGESARVAGRQRNELLAGRPIRIAATSLSGAAPTTFASPLRSIREREDVTTWPCASHTKPLPLPRGMCGTSNEHGARRSARLVTSSTVRFKPTEMVREYDDRRGNV